jgi:hypothetical protein
MLGGSRVTCSHQFDTDAFIVTIEMHQSMKMFRLQKSEFGDLNWGDFFKSINEWLRKSAN